MGTDLEQSIDRAEGSWKQAYRDGPSRMRWESVPLQAGDPAPEFELPDHSGNAVRLSSFWSEGPALILFWRQFGCGCGLERADRLNAELADYEEAGATVVIVGQGDPVRAAAYRDARGLRPPILCDVDLKAYRAYGILEGKPSQVLFDAPEEFLRLEPQAGDDLAAARREAGRPVVDSPWLLPGEFVVDGAGVVRLAYRWQYCEGYPDPRVHVAAIKESLGRIWQPS